MSEFPRAITKYLKSAEHPERIVNYLRIVKSCRGRKGVAEFKDPSRLPWYLRRLVTPMSLREAMDIVRVRVWRDCPDPELDQAIGELMIAATGERND